MGRAYRARQELLGREVALKVLDPRYKGDEDPEFQARFFLEASTAAKLSHPNTVTVFDYGKTSDDIYFIVMELVEGRTLSSMLKSMGALPRSAPFTSPCRWLARFERRMASGSSTATSSRRTSSSPRTQTKRTS